MTEYFNLTAQPPRGGCVLDQVRNFDGLIDLKRGRLGAIAHHFPSDVQLVMDGRYRKDVKLYDQLFNLDRLVVASAAMRSFLERLEVPAVEFLPVAIIDHKGKVASTDYSLVNPYAIFDCIDRTASTLEWNALDPDLVSSAFPFVLDDSKIEPEYPMFRIKHIAQYVFVRDDLAEQIEAEDLEGPYLMPLEDFNP